ncbi:MAG TPA: hypothetical protein PLV42_03710 [bacterium]|nr:hypothetical protein [bacterium]
MRNRLVDKLLDRMPIPDELKGVIGDQIDLSSLLTREMASQLLDHGGKIKDEMKVILAKELAQFLDKIDVDKALTNALEDLELEVRISFRRKDKAPERTPAKRRGKTR